MNEDVFESLLRKRSELEAQVQGLQSAIYHIEQTLELLGYDPVKPRVSGRRFANGELVALIGEAERAGHSIPTTITAYVMAAKGMNPNDEALHKRVMWSVKDCRKRTSAVVRAARG